MGNFSSTGVPVHDLALPPAPVLGGNTALHAVVLVHLEPSEAGPAVSRCGENLGRAAAEQGSGAALLSALLILT